MTFIICIFMLSKQELSWLLENISQLYSMIDH